MVLGNVYLNFYLHLELSFLILLSAGYAYGIVYAY